MTNKKKNKNKKILVIGGSGFLGSHLADELTNLGHLVTIFDKVRSKYLNKNQIFVLGNTNDNKLLNKLIKKNEYIYYFSGISDIEESMSNPEKTIESNLLNLISCLKIISKNKIKKFIYASTMYVYNSKGSFYRATKQSAEILINTFADHYKFDHLILRYGSLYGSRSQIWNGLNNYISQIIKNKKIIYYGDGEELREYIHVKDAARISANMINFNQKEKALVVTGNQIVSSKLLLNKIFEIAKLKKNIKFNKKNKNEYHYSLSPYEYFNEEVNKIVPDRYIDLDSGIMSLIKEINKNKN
jgi:Nucleoside-diphosphate-sugar epimerases